MFPVGTCIPQMVFNSYLHITNICMGAAVGYLQWKPKTIFVFHIVILEYLNNILTLLNDLRERAF